MSNRLKSILFAAIMCFVCSAMLTATSTGLQRFQKKNMLIDKHRNILKSVGLVEQDQRHTADEIESLYTQNIKPLWVDPAGQLIDESRRGENDFPLYVYVKEKQIEAYIVPINSRGVWAIRTVPAANGNLLLAMAMMCAGWENGPERHVPGFPDNGQWRVRWEGLRKYY